MAEFKSFSIWSSEFESSECVVSKRRGESLRVLGFRVSKFRISGFLEVVRVSSLEFLSVEVAKFRACSSEIERLEVGVSKFRV